VRHKIFVVVFVVVVVAAAVVVSQLCRVFFCEVYYAHRHNFGSHDQLVTCFLQFL
jgi:hypothetical protein